MHARITTIDGDPGRVDDALERVRSEVLPLLKEQEGWKGFTVMVDRSSGKMIGVSFFDSEETLAASDRAVAESRNRVADAGGSSGPKVEFFEVAIDETA
jgi:heme-degrading monooxygenase HmoA